MISSSSSDSSQVPTITFDETARAYGIYSKIEKFITQGMDLKEKQDFAKAIAHFRHAIIMYLSNTIQFTEPKQTTFTNMQTVLLELTVNPPLDVIYRVQPSWLEENCIVTPATMHNDISPESYQLIKKNIHPLALTDVLNFYLQKYDHYLIENIRISYHSLNIAYQIVHCLVASLADYKIVNITQVVKIEDVAKVVAGVVNFLQKYTAPTVDEQAALYNPTLFALEQSKNNLTSEFTQQDKDNWNFLCSHLIILASKNYFDNIDHTEETSCKKLLAYFYRMLLEHERLDGNWQGYNEFRIKFILIILKAYLQNTSSNKYSVEFQFYKTVRKYFIDLTESISANDELQQLFKSFHERFITHFMATNTKFAARFKKCDFLKLLKEIEIFFQNYEKSNSDKAALMFVVNKIQKFRRSHFVDATHLFQIEALIKDDEYRDENSVIAACTRDLNSNIFAFKTLLTGFNPELLQYALALQKLTSMLVTITCHKRLIEIFNRQLIYTCVLMGATQSHPFIPQVIQALQKVTVDTTSLDSLFIANFQGELQRGSEASEVNAIPVEDELPSLPIFLDEKDEEVLPLILSPVPMSPPNASAMPLLDDFFDDEEMKPQEFIGDDIDWFSLQRFPQSSPVDMSSSSDIPLLRSPPPLSFLLSAMSDDAKPSGIPSQYNSNNYTLFSPIPREIPPEIQDEKIVNRLG